PTRTHATGLIMRGSAVGLGALGLALLFAPVEGAEAFGWGAGGPLAPSLAASGFLAVAIMDWMGRTAIYGGIYGRPIVMANLVLSLTGGLPLLKSQMVDAGATPWGWVPAAVLAAHGTAFALLLFGFVGGPPPTKVPPPNQGTR
ncbi:MAG TPA: hypothetical protein VJ997_05195, partial [Longimicrobiales bacterium]|nr:hypothetical protein [Longimicrobiales bacterium]